MTVELGIGYDERVKGHILIVKSDEHLCLETLSWLLHCQHQI